MEKEFVSENIDPELLLDLTISRERLIKKRESTKESQDIRQKRPILTFSTVGFIHL